ncbi:MAG: chain length determinant protein tyrosine kinase EpsG [Burkholderiales bacterium]|nr:chain length determinant protein tyrosine kinase EpsG [Burkholderiales bacterium]
MLLRLQSVALFLLVVIWFAQAPSGPRPPDSTDAAAFVEQQAHSSARRFAGDLAVAALRRRRRRRPVRNEGDLAETLGEPLLAARPAREAALRELCRQLLEHWFIGGRALLPVVSAETGEGRTHLVASLAEIFAQMGVRTLLVDANLRSPGQHREFRIQNRRGLADLLADREVQPAVCGERLAVLAAGSSTGEPLELLSRPRLREFLAAAGKRFRVVLIDTPAAAEGPDLQIFAALAGGALVVHKKEADRAGLLGLRKHLQAARSRTVSVVLSG